MYKEEIAVEQKGTAKLRKKLGKYWVYQICTLTEELMFEYY